MPTNMVRFCLFFSSFIHLTNESHPIPTLFPQSFKLSPLYYQDGLFTLHLALHLSQNASLRNARRPRGCGCWDFSWELGGSHAIL